MAIFNMHDAKTRLSDLVARAEAGEEIVIARRNRPAVRLVPVEPEPKSRGWGAWEGRYRLPDSFLDPLPEEELRAWEGADEPRA